jgi:hypothetical protein
MPQMPDHRRRSRGPEHVYEVPPDLREVDELLEWHARQQPVPAGLIDRVFDASVGLLPSHRPRRQPVLRLQPTIMDSLWSRLAMAASIALAFIVAARMLPVSGPGSLLSPDVELVQLDYGAPGDLDVHWRFRAREEAWYGQVERLGFTQEMSFRDLAGDLANLAADLEM